MKTTLIKRAVRLRFMLTGRQRASRGIRQALERYLALAKAIGPEGGRQTVRVPSMLGVDENMRDWSFFMILEHNVIVNRYIHGVVDNLAQGEIPAVMTPIDMKKDVMPSADPGEAQVAALRSSVDAYLEAVSRLPRPWSKTTARHPIFGQLTARGWHCMFGFHLKIHLRQANAVARLLASG